MDPLIHIGYAKTGSTFLQSNIFNENFGFYNPYDIYSSEIIQKLILTNSFEYDALETRKFFEEKYKKSGEKNLCPVISAEDLSGHLFANRNNYEKEISQRLKETFPNAKVLIVVREQKSIIKSAWRHYLRKNGAQSISRFIGKKNIKDGFSPILRLDKLKYDLLVSYYQELFGNENVLVLPFELLKVDQRGYITKILAFAGLELKNIKDLYEPENLSPKAIELFICHKLGFFMHKDILGEKTAVVEKVINKVSRFFGLVTPNFINKKIEGSWEKYISEMTKDYYRDSNKKLSQLIGHDLRVHGYEL